MKTATIQDIKRHGSKAISGDDPVYLIVNSKVKSVVLPLHEYENMMDALDDYASIIAIEERKNDPLVEWEDVFPEDKA